MSKNHITMEKRHTFIRETSAKAFTFVEVIIALAIVSVSLLGLIKLHITNINMTETAEITSRAVLLAEEKIAETLATSYPNQGTNQGSVQKNALRFNWQTEVKDLQLPKLDQADICGLRTVSVDVSWKQGISRKHLQMLTYVADRKLQ
ncbi:MAG: prepilin-type N-terminal cleavage/methylation domain-containing protein [Planctomycetes bacterium]|nr:prepilin-type N-terminal cleavage/methylation domain-containing protein [Planctomycetota bacterium]